VAVIAAAGELEPLFRYYGCIDSTTVYAVRICPMQEIGWP
jgi:hypothetical protein